MAFTRNYPIWINVIEDCYKSNRSFGAEDGATMIINVGTSKKNSTVLATVEIINTEDGFELYVDKKLIKTLR